MNAKKCLAVVLFGFTFTIGCAQNTPTPPLTAPPDGVYTMTLTKAEFMNHGLSETDACESAGTYTMTVKGEKFVANRVPEQGCTTGVTSYTGTLKFTDHQVAFHEDRYNGCLPDYTYNWSFDGTALTFTQDKVICGPYLELHPWVKVAETPPTPMQPPDGKYSYTLKESELIYRGVKGAEMCELKGTWTLELKAGRWSTSHAPASGCSVTPSNSGGTWSIAADKIRFQEDNPVNCSSDSTYQWSFLGKNLFLTALEDNCSARVKILSQVPWETTQ